MSTYRIPADTEVWRYKQPVSPNDFQFGDVIRTLREVVYTDADIFMTDKTALANKYTTACYYFVLPRQALPWLWFAVNKRDVQVTP